MQRFNALCNNLLALSRIIIDELGSKILARWGMLAGAANFVRLVQHNAHASATVCWSCAAYL